MKRSWGRHGTKKNEEWMAMGEIQGKQSPARGKEGITRDKESKGGKETRKVREAIDCRVQKRQRLEWMGG